MLMSYTLFDGPLYTVKKVLPSFFLNKKYNQLAFLSHFSLNDIKLTLKKSKFNLIKKLKIAYLILMSLMSNLKTYVVIIY